MTAVYVAKDAQHTFAKISNYLHTLSKTKPLRMPVPILQLGPQQMPVFSIQIFLNKIELFVNLLYKAEKPSICLSV